MVVGGENVKYDFKPLQETAWAVTLIVAGIALPFLVSASDAQLGSKAFWIAVAVAVLRGVAGYLLSLLPRAFRQPPPEP